MGDLLCFKMVMILPILQMLGIVFCSMEWLNMSVRALMGRSLSAGVWGAEPPHLKKVITAFIL